MDGQAGSMDGGGQSFGDEGAATQNEKGMVIIDGAVFGE